MMVKAELRVESQETVEGLETEADTSQGETGVRGAGGKEQKRGRDQRREGHLAEMVVGLKGIEETAWQRTGLSLSRQGGEVQATGGSSVEGWVFSGKYLLHFFEKC